VTSDNTPAAERINNIVGEADGSASTQTRPLARPSRTGVRIAGDDYQWLHAWHGCLRVLRDQSPQTRAANPAMAVGVEVDHAHNVDDVVIYRQQPPHSYSQVKYAVDAATPLNTALLTTTANNGDNLLRKFAAAYATLTVGGEPVEMSLVTNRSIDPTDILLAGCDSRSGLLLPRAAEQTAASRRGQQRKVWAEAAGITETQLLELLTVLKFETGYGVRLLTDNVANLMTALGLKSDRNAHALALRWVQQQVINGVRMLDLDTIRGAVESLGLEVGPAWSTISIATLKPDPLADQAIHVLDWSDKFDGDDPYTRRRPKPPATWSQLDAEIKSLPDNLCGVHAALITGSLRLPTGFAIGAALRGVAGFQVAIRQGQQLWRSDEIYAAQLQPDLDETYIGAGEDLAVVIDIATNATPDVTRWIIASGLPMSRVLSIRPPGSRPKDNAIPDARTAIALALGVRDTVRTYCQGVPRIHLFQAGPLGLAVLLGHRWNRLRPTVVYEELPVSATYEPAFQVQA
jgi:hypothetical protein